MDAAVLAELKSKAAMSDQPSRLVSVQARDLLALIKLAEHRADYVYNPEDWEATYPIGDQYEIVDGLGIDPGHVRKLATLCDGPPIWVANVVVSRDDDGDADETEIKWFDTEADAFMAVGDTTEQAP